MVVQLETSIKEEWAPVIRYNYSHGFPHKDLLFSNRKKIKEDIFEDNLAKVVNLAINDLKRNWKKYLRRCGYEKEE